MIPDDPDELTAAAIARMVGVGRAAVSNWRRRYPEFPRPIGGSPTSPRFSRKEVEAWLLATGKGHQLATAGQTDTGTGHVVSSPNSQEERYDERMRRLSERGITDLSPAELLAKAMASLLPRSTAAEEPVIKDDADAPTVLDPAGSHGTLLMAAADRFGEHVRLAGQESEEVGAAAATMLLRQNPYATPYEIEVGNSLTDNRLRAHRGSAAGVLCQVPADQRKRTGQTIDLPADLRWEFGVPGAKGHELAWVTHSYAYLRPNGVAVIAVSPRTCTESSGRDVRAGLVRSGALREVITLPKGIGPRPNSEVCLWVLQRLPASTDAPTVRMIDLSALSDPAEVPHEFGAWQRLFGNPDPTIIRSVPRPDLLTGDTDLRPSRHLAVRAKASAAELDQVTDRLRDLYSRIGEGLPRFTSPTSPPRRSYVSIGEMERLGALRIRSRETTPRRGDLLLRTLGRPPAVAAGTEADESGVAHVVQVDPARLDSHFLAGFLQADSHSLPVANTLGAISREDLRRCLIPDVGYAEQRRYGDAFRHLQGLQAALAALARISASLIDQTIHGLTTGAVAPDFIPQQKTGNSTEGETSEL
ncbi:N-6 DNA methylase [Glycomyces buryatensis]|uniref:SAM-dependent methyltransferase n=1 Tax=Glycomyces buryatensis TaxID=2570927 RepID=A0A4S8QF74_9ACTN|nr:N-6 DNA methylase [Glycomyces buryatensis]THV43020.1 SAM-dependent methyltransferase [Glycomyces buryatensis]